MGDVVFPGIVLTRVAKEVTASSVQNYIIYGLKIGKNELRDGKAKVEIYKRDWNSIVVISGALVQLDRLRELIGHKKLLNRFLFFESVDFGIPRNTFGLMDHHNYQLHKHLQEGQGILKPFNIFRDPFIERFGDIQSIGYSIFFDDVKTNVEQDYLYNSKDVILFGNIPKKSKSGVVFGETKMDYENMEVVLKSRLDALQRICMWNKNSLFSSKKRSFVTGKDGFLCLFSGNCGVGVSGSVIKVSDIFKEVGYIPKSSLNLSIFCGKKIESMGITCSECGEKYNILGIDKDVSWSAAICGCKTYGPGYTWNDEKFFRLTTPPSRRKYIPDCCEEDEVNLSTYDRVVRLIPGLKSTYESVGEFKDIAYGAYCSEHRFNKRLLRSQKTSGVIIGVDFIETLKTGEEGQQTTERWAYYIEVDETKTWSEKGQHGIKDVTIVPLIENSQTSSADDVSPEPYKEAKNHLWISSTRYGIYPIQDSNKVKVTLILTVDTARKLVVGSKVNLIPTPPDDEKKSIAASIKSWEDYVSNRDKPKIHSTVNSAVICTQTVWNSNWEVFNVWYVKLTVESLEVFEKLSEVFDECYIGLQTKLNGYPDDYIARVVGIEAGLEGSKILQVVFVLKQHIELTLGSGAELSLWMIAPTKIILNKKNVLQAHDALCLCDICPQTLRTDELEENTVFDDDNDYDDKDHDYTFVRNENDNYNCVQVYVDKDLGQQRPNDLDWILREWRDKPEIDLSILDYFLNAPIKHVFTPFPVHQEMNESKIVALRSPLNPSQVSAIDSMLANHICECQGPPGTGKTTTIAHGAGDLFCREGGLILICCPSNFASNVIYEKLVSVNEKFRVGMSITRMYSVSREREHANKIASLMNEDPHLLHVAVVQHPFWRLDDEVNLIIDKVEQGFGALLTTGEKKSLRTHTMAITRIILSSTDVVICTVSAASDYRIASCLKYCRRFEKPLTALIIDEASLLNVPATVPILCHNPRRVWLVGDDCQLRPTIFDETSRFACLDVSWMEFLRLTPHFKQNEMFSLLNIQYRMSEPVAEVVSSYMYYGRVQSSGSVKARNYKDHGKLRTMPELQNTNIACYTYNGYGERKPKNGSSYTNVKEVAVTRRIVRRIAELGVDLSTVVIISMYDAHVAFLRKMLSDLGNLFNDIEVATVDSYQGKENKIVILNTVRSNPDHNVGFLREKRRLNVAISRSIDYLLIVADIETLKKCQLPDMTSLMNLLVKQGVMLKEYRCYPGRVQQITSSTLNEYLKNC